MLEEEIIDHLTRIFSSVFSLPDIEIDRDLTAFDIDEWDSLSHIRLILSVEKKFKIRISSAEIETLDNVGSMIDLIEQKLR